MDAPRGAAPQAKDDVSRDVTETPRTPEGRDGGPPSRLWRTLDLSDEWAQKGPKMLSLISKFVRRLRRNRRPYMPALILAGC